MILKLRWRERIGWDVGSRGGGSSGLWQPRPLTELGEGQGEGAISTYWSTGPGQSRARDFMPDQKILANSSTFLAS